MEQIDPYPTYEEIKADWITWPDLRNKKYWKYRQDWQAYPKTKSVPDFPLGLDIETTNICNLSCQMCPRTIQIKNKTYAKIGTMSMELYQKIIDEASLNNCPSIKLNYLGEPLEDEFLVERIKYAKQKGIVEVMFNTNAVNLTKEKSMEILQAGIDSVYFSVDSVNADNYNKIRVGADYYQVERNIIDFCRLARDEFPHVQTRISMTILPGFEKEVEPFKEKWLPIAGVVGFGRWVQHTSTSKEYPYNPNFVCASPYQRMFILWDGIVTPCCVDDARGYIYGDVSKETVRNVWLSKQANHLRDKMNNHKYNEIDICKRCYVPLDVTKDKVP